MSEPELYLVSYRHFKSEPFKSITQLSEDEAFALAKKLYENSSCPAHKRFGPDFAQYYPHRLMTEKWLYERFKALGGKPQTEHPYYFAFHHCENLYTNFDSGVVTKIKLSDIDISDVSFTFGDSIAQMNRQSNPEPFLKDKLIKYISEFDHHVESFLESVIPRYVCIEAQLWTDQYFGM